MEGCGCRLHSLEARRGVGAVPAGRRATGPRTGLGTSSCPNLTPNPHGIADKLANRRIHSPANVHYLLA